MNKPLLKFLCQIGGIDFYTVPDYADIHLRERDRSPWMHPHQMMPSPIAAAAIVLGGKRITDESGKQRLAPFLVRYLGGKVAADSREAPEDKDGFAYACLTMVLTDLQFAQAKMLEHPANFTAANP